LTPNIKLDFFSPSRSRLLSTQGWRFLGHCVRIDSAFDQSFAFPARNCHLRQFYDGADDNERQRDHQDPPTPTTPVSEPQPVSQNEDCHHACQALTPVSFILLVLRKLDFLVELTGIEPVASWLQTRRSPS
jgi:hypothetical protein